MEGGNMGNSLNDHTHTYVHIQTRSLRAIMKPVTAANSILMYAFFRQRFTVADELPWSEWRLINIERFERGFELIIHCTQVLNANPLTVIMLCIIIETVL